LRLTFSLWSAAAAAVVVVGSFFSLVIRAKRTRLNRWATGGKNRPDDHVGYQHVVDGRD